MSSAFQNDLIAAISPVLVERIKNETEQIDFIALIIKYLILKKAIKFMKDFLVLPM